MNRRRFLHAGAGLIALKPTSFLLAGAAVQRVESPHGAFSLQDLALSQDLTIHGSATNHTDRDWRWVSFLIRMRDAAGRLISHDDRFDGHFYVQHLPRNETKGFVDRKGNPARLLLRPTQPASSVEAEFITERSYFDSRYVFSLETPHHSPDLVFEDERLRLELKPAERFHVGLRNRSAEAATLDWEKISYFDLDGAKHRLIHGDVDLKEKDKPQTPRVLDAGASLETTLYPADQVIGSRIFEDWRLSPLLPLSQYAPHYKWRAFSIVVPWTTRSQTHQYVFTVRIDDVIV